MRPLNADDPPPVTRKAALQGRIAALRTLIADAEMSLNRLRQDLGKAEDEMAEIQDEFLTGDA